MATVSGYRSCLNCGARSCNVSRGLCPRCYNQPEIRRRFPCIRFQKRNFDDAPKRRALPPEPTEYLPGTIGKMDVMAWRIENGYLVHHPLDARY